VLFRSADEPDRLRGPNLSGAWRDEASLVSVDAFNTLIGRLRESGEQGWLTATFTPRGRAHSTFATFATGRPDTALFHARAGFSFPDPLGNRKWKKKAEKTATPTAATAR
jgi:hypothetical protein